MSPNVYRTETCYQLPRRLPCCAAFGKGYVVSGQCRLVGCDRVEPARAAEELRWICEVRGLVAGCPPVLDTGAAGGGRGRGRGARHRQRVGGGARRALRRV